MFQPYLFYNMYSEEKFRELIKILPGVKTLYKKNGVYIIKVTSFNSCNKLFNRDTIDWCIARNKDHWNEYITHPGNDQYFIVDFNNINSANQESYNSAFIGFTIDKNDRIYAAHARNDRNLLNTYYGERYFDALLKEKKLYDFVFKQKMTLKKTQNNAEKSEEYASMVPVYFLIGSILLAMMTLFIR